MQHAQTCLNPFAMLIDPDRVLLAVQGSDHLKRLRSQTFHPLDQVRPKRGTCAMLDQVLDETPGDALN